MAKKKKKKKKRERQGERSSTPPVVIVLRALWKMLVPRQRAMFSLLCFLLVITALLEMGGMMVLFGFVRGLEANPETGRRGGRLATVLRHLSIDLDTQLQYVMWGGLVVMGYMLFKNMMATGVRFGLNRFLMKVNQRVSERLYRAYMMAPYETFAGKGFKGPMKDIARLFDLFNSCFNATVHLLADSSMLLAVVALLFFVDPLLTGLAVVLFGGVGVGLYSTLQRQLRRMGKEQEDADRRMGQFLKEGLQGLIDIRLRGSRGYFFQGYSAALGRVTVLKRRTQAMARLPRSANELALGALVVGATLYVTLHGHTVSQALPTLGIFAFAALRMNGVISRVNVAAQTLRRRAGQFEEAYARLREITPGAIGGDDQTAPEDYLKDEKELPGGVDGKLHDSLELVGVGFSYPGAPTPALAEVSLTVRRGEFIGICGPSGGGKTTLLLLLMGIMRPTAGRVQCDGWSVFDHIQAWHRNIGYVSQSGFVVGRSIRDNITFGVDESKVSDERVWAALELASAAEFVRALPNGLDSTLHDAGTNLSGGQRQRLMIARALYPDPEVLVLDEATAALDNLTEREVTQALGSLSGRKTMVCVAHRLSTIRDCDRIYYVSRGSIAAYGTYDELLRSSPEFAEMARATPGGSSLDFGRSKLVG